MPNKISSCSNIGNIMGKKKKKMVELYNSLDFPICVNYSLVVFVLLKINWANDTGTYKKNKRLIVAIIWKRFKPSLNQKLKLVHYSKKILETHIENKWLISL